MPNFQIFLYIIDQRQKCFRMIHNLFDFHVHVRKNHILKLRKFQTPEISEILKIFRKFSDIRDQWAELFHLIYSLWAFPDKSGQPYTPYRISYTTRGY